MTPELRARLVQAAEAPVLLVACDYDGTLSPIVTDPSAAWPDPGALHALSRLALLDHTHGALVSGRDLRGLWRLSGAPDGLHLIGSHGAERGPASPAPSPAQRDLVEQVALALDAIATRAPGLLVERKPLSCALHYRAAAEADGRAAADSARALGARLSGVIVREGLMVVELCVTSARKGAALLDLKSRTGASSVLFFGDDLTDEDAFGALGPSDVGVKVGAGGTVAAWRVLGVPEVAEALACVLDHRTRWLAGRALVPIERHALLSDQRTVAVVTPRARINWLCVPRIDSGAIFGELVGGPGAGFFDVEPADPAMAARTPAQRYDPDTFTLRTSWGQQGEPGWIVVTDYFDCGGGRPFQRAGRSDLIRVIEGSGPVRIEFAPRLDFGRLPTGIDPVLGGLMVQGGADPLALTSPDLPWRIRQHGQSHTAEATFNLDGRPIVLELRCGSGSLREAVVPEATRREQSGRFWSGWAASLRLPTLHAAAVKRSALVLKALCHGPTGAIAAAATTSLPEHLGGVRNWDYRYCWPRDACLAAGALVRLGNTGHALKLLDWLLGVVDACESPDRLRPIYTVVGRELPPEAELSHLTGYGGSRPVRIGNAAAAQVQLDVFGPIADLIATLVEHGAPVSPDHWRLARAMVQAVEARWAEPDHGIWEIRSARRHHVHSKVMCWLTVERALLVQEHVIGRRDAAWERLRAQIADDVRARAWNEQAGAFTGYYGSTDLDAAALCVGLTGLVPPTDPRFIATVAAVNAQLRDGGGVCVRRYLGDDGLPGPEGGMLICTGWLIEALHVVGRRDEARALLDALVALCGPVGIAAEQFDPRHRIALGNFAQAYSHLAIINAAVRLSAAAG